jgi:hypothetical protein
LDSRRGAALLNRQHLNGVPAFALAPRCVGADRLGIATTNSARSAKVKNVLLLVIGVGAGFVIAHLVSKTPAGKQFFETVEGRAKELGAAVVDGYRAR